MSTADCFSTIENRFRHWNYGHPKTLYGLIRTLKPQNVVEVGTYQGYAACYMARAIQENDSGRVWCIDNFTLQDHPQNSTPIDFWEESLRLCGVRDWATLLVGDSEEVEWPDKVDFAYVDGWHSYKKCRADVDNCIKRGAETICMDDTANCVGPRLVAQQLRESGEWDVIELGNDNGLSICRRRTPQRGLTFSQEVEGHPGYQIGNLSGELLRDHFETISKITGVDYTPLL